MTWTILASINLACALLSYSFLAYALAQLHWRGRGIFLALFAIIISGQVWLIPQAIATWTLGSNILLYPIWFANWLVLAFGIVLISNSLRNTSPDMADAARLDGCGALGIYWHVVLPLVRRTLFLLAIFTVMATWIEFVAPLEHVPPSGLVQVSSDNVWLLLPASLLMTLPAIVIFCVTRRSSRAR